MVGVNGDVEVADAQGGRCASDLEPYSAGGRDRANIVLMSGGDVGSASGDDVFELLAGGARSVGELS
jgi:hypothetical protein